MKGRPGFAPGDPRNPGKRQSRRKNVADDLQFIQSLVPYGTLGRDDIISEIWLALFEGRVTRANLQKRTFVGEFMRKNYEQSGRSVEFDKVAFAIAQRDTE